MGKIVPKPVPIGLSSDHNLTEDSWTCLRIFSLRDPALIRVHHEEIPMLILTTENYDINRKRCDNHVGIVFVQAHQDKLSQFLEETVSSARLQYDHATQKSAIVSHQEMNLLIKLSRIPTCKVWYLKNSLDYYRQGNDKVRVLEGVLAGIEGYVMRMVKDRKLVFQAAGKVMCIGGAHRLKYESIDYIFAAEDEEPYGGTHKTSNGFNIQLKMIDNYGARRKQLLSENKIMQVWDYDDKHYRSLKKRNCDFTGAARKTLDQALQHAVGDPRDNPWPSNPDPRGQNHR